MQEYKTEQEQFWATEFGNEYIGRNQGANLLASNLHFFSKALQRAGKIGSCIEFGANIGMNLKALQLLYPQIGLSGVEINEQAATELKALIEEENVFHGSIFEASFEKQAELTLIKGVLIHINPEMLPVVYEKLYQFSSRYILVAEYYNPAPVALNYRGHEQRLFKRDFAGELLEKYLDLELIDYGFAYRRDPAFPQDDITWFLLEKKEH